MRACPDCGLAESRQVVNGRPEVNLDPVSGRCIRCLVAYWQTQIVQPMPATEPDWRKAASGERDE